MKLRIKTIATLAIVLSVACAGCQKKQLSDADMEKISIRKICCISVVGPGTESFGTEMNGKLKKAEYIVEDEDSYMKVKLSWDGQNSILTANVSLPEGNFEIKQAGTAGQDLKAVATELADKVASFITKK